MPATTRPVPTLRRQVRLTDRSRSVPATALTAAVLERRPVLVRASGATVLVAR